MRISYKRPNSQAKHLNRIVFSSTFIADSKRLTMLTVLLTLKGKRQLPNNISI